MCSAYDDPTQYDIEEEEAPYLPSIKHGQFGATLKDEKRHKEECPCMTEDDPSVAHEIPERASY